MRARLALVASQTEVELREIILRDKPEHMVQLSPKATVPVLWLPDGTVIDESLDIMLWALQQNDPEGWLVLTDDQKTDATTLLEQLDNTFKHHLDRYKYASRHNTDPQEHLQVCLDILLQWEQRIAQNKGYLLSGQAKYIDFALLPFVRQFRMPDPNVFDRHNDLPNLQQWLNNYLKSGFYEKIMLKYALWQPGQEAVFL